MVQCVSARTEALHCGEALISIATDLTQTAKLQLCYHRMKLSAVVHRLQYYDSSQFALV